MSGCFFFLKHRVYYPTLRILECLSTTVRLPDGMCEKNVQKRTLYIKRNKRSFVARHSVYVLRQNSPVGRNALRCCMRFGLRLDMLKLINRNFVSRRVSTEVYAYNLSYNASVIYDLLCVKSHQAELSILDAADIDLIIVS